MAKDKGIPGTFLTSEVPPLIPQEECLLASYAEAPATQEQIHKEPLVGPSGKIWNWVLFQLGIRRRYVYIDNVCRVKLPKNDTDYLWKITRTGRFKTHPDWNELVERMKSDIRQLDTKLIVLLGGTPLVAMLGSEYSSIDSYRGYPFWWEDKLLMPTYHPARCLPDRAPQLRYIVYADVLKGIRIAKEGIHNERVKVYIPGRGWSTQDL